MTKSILGCIVAFLIHFNVNANLLVSPTRAELNDTSNKSAVFSLVNKGEATARYNIYFEDKVQLADGGYESVENTKATLSTFVRYSPRRVTLEPEQGTRVRMAARLPKNTVADEYRSYIVFHQIPLAPPPTVSSSSDDVDTFNLTVTAYVRISIPVILRVGQLTGDVTINTVEDENGRASLDVVINRQGQRSTYGDIEVFVETTIDGSSVLESIGNMKNAAIYTELDSKRFAISLSRSLAKGESVIVRYTESKTLKQAKRVETRVVI